MKLSIVMMVKNEEKYIEASLKSLEPLRNSIPSELIILDTGSDDRTPEIAKNYTDKLYFHQWNDDFAAMRNLSISYAKGEWILVLDGDEVLEDTRDIIDFFKGSKHKKYQSATLKIKNYMDVRKKTINISTIVRFFKRIGFQYSGAVHEQPNFKMPMYHINSLLGHYGYISDDPQLMEKKFKRNVPILEKELEKDPENVYILYQLSQSYSMYHDNITALKYIQRAYDTALKNKLDLKHRMYIYMQLLNMLFSNGKNEETVKLAKKAISTQDGYLDVYYFLGAALEKLNKIDEALENYEKFIDMARNYEKFIGYNDIATPSLTSGYLERVMAKTCTLYYNEKKYEMALSQFKLLKDPVLKGKISIAFIGACVKTERLEELKNYYSSELLPDKKKDFISDLEKYMLAEEPEVRRKIWELFKDESGQYGLLMKIRIRPEEKDAIDETRKWSFNELPSYYGDILLYQIKMNDSIVEMLRGCSERKLTEFFRYIFDSNRHSQRELFQLILDYSKDLYGCKDFRLRKVIRKCLLTDKLLVDKHYLGVFKGFIFEGIQDLFTTYQRQLIEDQSCFNRLKTDEDVFFAHMYHYLMLREESPSDAIRLLRKALKVLPELSRGIELLIKEKDERLNTNSEFLSIAAKLKSTINDYIVSGSIEAAEEILKEYEAVNPKDIAIYSIKSMIEMHKKNWVKAEEAIKEGLSLELYNFDLLCNGAFYCQTMNQTKEAITLYEGAILATSSEQQRQQLKELIADLKGNPLNNQYNQADSKKHPQDELEHYKESIKDKIKALINNNNLHEARLLLKEYNSIIEGDMESVLLESELLIRE